MNDESIFLTALKLTDPDKRRAYLDKACAGNPSLRDEVESLLRASAEDSQFLEIPAAVQLEGNPDRSANTEGTEVLDAVEANQPGPRAPSDEEWSFLTPSPREDALGRLGPYEVLEVIGKGAFGTVFQAFDEKLHRVVAIKVLSPQVASNKTARLRFLREARAAAAVVHDHVITIHGVDEVNGLPFIVMQLVAGPSLEDKLERTGILPIKEILRIGMQTAEGLAAAHHQGLIHRDIKPENILLENGIERVKITDFGLARAVDDTRMTQSGLIAGTPLFMSPEQAAGEPLDVRSDLFQPGQCPVRDVHRSGPFFTPAASCDDYVWRINSQDILILWVAFVLQTTSLTSIGEGRQGFRV